MYRPHQNGGEPEKRSIKDAIANRFRKSPAQQKQLQNNSLPLNNEPSSSAAADKRASFANNSFRQATGQPQQHPPQVPPKPTVVSSSSRERLKESIEEVNNLDQVCNATFSILIGDVHVKSVKFSGFLDGLPIRISHSRNLYCLISLRPLHPSVCGRPKNMPSSNFSVTMPLIFLRAFP